MGGGLDGASLGFDPSATPVCIGGTTPLNNGIFGGNEDHQEEEFPYEIGDTEVFDFGASVGSFLNPNVGAFSVENVQKLPVDMTAMAGEIVARSQVSFHPSSCDPKVDSKATSGGSVYALQNLPKKLQSICGSKARARSVARSRRERKNCVRGRSRTGRKPRGKESNKGSVARGGKGRAKKNDANEGGGMGGILFLLYRVFLIRFEI